MATKAPAKTTESAETPEAGPKKKSKLPLLIGAGVLLLAAIGGGAFFFLRGHDEGPKEKAEVKPAVPVFMQLEMFTVNLANSGQGDHYMQIGLTLQLENEAAQENVKAFLPVIRNRLLLLMSAKSVEELEGVENKNKFSNEILQSVRNSLPGNTPSRGVSGVLFSSMVIQ